MNLLIIIFIAMVSTLVQSENHVKITNDLIEDIRVEKRSASTEEEHVKTDADQETSQTTAETPTESNTQEETISREETTRKTSNDEDNISTTSTNEIESTVEMKTTSKTSTTTRKPKRMIPKPTLPTIIDILDHVKSDIDKIHATIVEPALDLLRFPPLSHDILSTFPIKPHHLQKRRITRLDFDKILPCFSEGYFRLNHSCKKFYRCKFNKISQKIVPSHIYTCHRCFVFNAKKGHCDFPENVPECNLYNENKTTDFCTGTGNFSVFEDCHKYYECNEGKNGNIELRVKTCPGKTTFNVSERKCVEGNECVSYPTCETPHIKLADKYDCHKFYQCTANKTPVPFYCPDGTIFSGYYCKMFDTSITMTDNNSPLTNPN